MSGILTLENFIDGKFVPSDKFVDSFDPSTGSVNAKVPDSGKNEVYLAVRAAVKAFPNWSSLAAQKRADFLLRVADLIEEQLEAFATAESGDQGKPIWLSRSIDIPRAILNFRHFAHIVPHNLDESKYLPDHDTLCYTSRSAVGVAGLISPWNLPLYLLSFKIAPALACGCTVVAKPSEMTSVTAYMLCKVFKQAGLPDGVINMVFGLGPNVGAPLVTHPDVPLISFTGSTVTGRVISKEAAPLFKKLSLEMGGKNAAIVFSDCELDKTLKTLIRASFINSGQVCLCTSRIFVQRPIYKQFLEKFIQITRKLKVGDPRLSETFMGALNSKLHLEKVQRYVQFAIEDGGKIECGHTVDTLDLPKELANGYFMCPTVISGLSDASRCMQEEIFGPVTCVTPFDSTDEVIKRANGTDFGLCATVWSKDIHTTMKMARELKVGTVWTNCWMVRDLDIPFGGVKMSGMGREGTNGSVHFYTEQKAICHNIEA